MQGRRPQLLRRAPHGEKKTCAQRTTLRKEDQHQEKRKAGSPDVISKNNKKIMFFRGERPEHTQGANTRPTLGVDKLPAKKTRSTRAGNGQRQAHERPVYSGIGLVT